MGDPIHRLTVSRIGVVLTAGLILILLFGAITATVLLVPKYYGEVKTPGEFGEMFGAANAVFSGLAFAGVIYTLFLQRQELQRHRQEFEASLKMNATVALFEYCNNKISSLRVAWRREKRSEHPDEQQADTIQKNHEEFKKIHEHLRKQLKLHYPELEFPSVESLPGGNKHA